MDFTSLSLTERHRHPISFLRQTDKRILSAPCCQPDTEVPSVFSDGWKRRSRQPPQTAGSGRTDRARKRPDIQTKECGSSSIRTDAGTLPGPHRSRRGSPDRRTGPGSGGPTAGPVSPLAGGNPSPVRLTRSRRGQTKGSGQTDGQDGGGRRQRARREHGRGCHGSARHRLFIT